jgi:hypothetical protein
VLGNELPRDDVVASGADFRFAAVGACQPLEALSQSATPNSASTTDHTTRRRKRGQFIYYRLLQDNLANTLNGFVQEICPVSRPLKKESARLAEAKQEG